MNKIFKIVFNAARGKMMVVNEATSSVQTGKKAAVTVAVIGALATGTAVAADEIVVNHKHTDQVLQEAVSVTYAEKLDANKTKNDGGKIAGVVLFQSAVDFNDGVAISVTNNGSTSADEAYGLNAQSDPGTAKAVATVSGDSSISAKSASSGAYAVFSSGPTSSVVFNSGDVSASAEGGTEASAVWVWRGASLKGSSNLELSAKSKDAYGIVNGYYYVSNSDTAVHDSGTVDLTGDVVITATTTDANGAAYGLYTSGAGSETTMSGNVTIKALGVAGSSHLAINSENNSVVNLGSEGKTVDLMGLVVVDEAELNLDGNTTLKVEDLESNVVKAVTLLNSTLTASANVKLDVKEVEATTGAVALDVNSGQVAFEKDFTLNLSGSSNLVYGIQNRSNGSELSFGGLTNINVSNTLSNPGETAGLLAIVSTTNFKGDTSISAEAYQNVRGVKANDNSALTHVVFEGTTTTINATSLGADANNSEAAIGVITSGGTDDIKLSFNGQSSNITATATNGGAVGLKAQERSVIEADSDMNVTVKAEAVAVGIKTSSGPFNPTNPAALIELRGNVNVVAVGGESSLAVSVQDKGTVSLGSQGKTVNLTGDVQVAEGSTLNLYGDVTLNGTSTIAGTLGGEAQILLGDEDASVTVSGTNNSKATIGSTGEVTDALGGDVSKLADKFVGFDDAEKIVMQEGEVIGAVSADLEGGEVVANSVTQAVNKKTEALAEQVTLAPQMIQRIMMNDVRKRMGDLRAAEGTHGVWARYNGGQMAGSGMEADFSMVQVGIDTVPVVDAPRFGVAFSYAQTEADATNGLATTDMDTFSLAFYGTKMYDNGMFVDVIGRMATMDTEMTVAGNKAEMDNVALSLSGEFGWRFDVTDQFFIEPSAELTYTYTNADTFKMGRGEYELESVDSLVGRAGFAAGFKCPANKGDVYVRAAVVHEFMGDSTMNSKINGRSATPVESDGEDTYFEYAVGAQFNVNKNTYVYADVERTEGANVDEDWRANVGVRFAF